MKKLNAKSWFMIILGAIMVIVSIAVMIIGSTETETEGTEGITVLSAVTFILSIVCLFIGLRPLWTMSEKNITVIEATFVSIGKYSDGWYGCYFDVDGKQTRIAILNEVYSPRLLMPGAKYKITQKNKDGTVIAVERID